MESSLIARLEAAVNRLERLGGGSGAGAHAADEHKLPVSVVAYDAFYQAHVQPFVDTCAKLEAAHQIGKDLESCFRFQRQLFLAASECKKPSQADLMKFVDPIVQIVSKAQNTDNRSPFFAHQKAFGEFIQCMNWLFMPGPVAIIKATLEAADFYLVKILTSTKDLPNEEDKKNHRAFVQQIKDLINSFADFVKEQYLTGIIWNAKGKGLNEFKVGGSPAGVPAAPAAAGPGVPPPPPPVDVNVKLSAEDPSAAAKPAVGGLGAVFAEINKKGEDGVTTGLKKVTSDMKTKNLKDKPALEPKSSGSSSAVAAVAAAPTRTAQEEKKPASVELKQGTWFCENQEDVQLEIPDVQMKQSVYVYKAKNSVITVPTKCKSIQLDSCFKTTIVFNSIVSSLEVVNGKRITIIIQESCPSITIDKTNGCSVVLNEASVKEPPNIVTSLASELNIVVPGKTPEDDPVEMAVAEQFLTTYKDGRVSTIAVEHKG